MPIGGYYTSFQVQKETIRLNFSMTINKTQGQTIPNIGIYLSEPMFSHRHCMLHCQEVFLVKLHGSCPDQTKTLTQQEKEQRILSTHMYSRM